MGRRKKKLKPVIFCYYCDREFENEKVLIQHQRAKHFKCRVCHKRLGSAHGMMIHVFQVHKENIETVPSAKEGRDSFDANIFGMTGVPPDIIDEKRAELGEPPLKRQRIEVDSDTSANATLGSAANVAPNSSLSSGVTRAPAHTIPNSSLLPPNASLGMAAPFPGFPMFPYAHPGAAPPHAMGMPPHAMMPHPFAPPFPVHPQHPQFAIPHPQMHPQMAATIPLPQPPPPQQHMTPHLQNGGAITHPPTIPPQMQGYPPQMQGYPPHAPYGGHAPPNMSAMVVAPTPQLPHSNPAAQTQLQPQLSQASVNTIPVLAKVNSEALQLQTPLASAATAGVTVTQPKNTKSSKDNQTLIWTDPHLSMEEKRFGDVKYSYSE